MTLYYDYRQWSPLSIKHWPVSLINKLRKEIWTAKESAVFMKNNNSNRQRLSRKQNPHLFKLLSIIGFFDYHITNNGFTCYLYQINHFINGGKNLDKSGWQDYRAGNFMQKNEWEIHHLNHNPIDDSPSNLIKTTPYENKLLSTCVKGGFYIGKVIKEKITCMVKFEALVKQTQIATLTRLAKESFVIFSY
jgi:hypothetical protein